MMAAARAKVQKPSICCVVMDHVLGLEKENARTGLARVIAMWSVGGALAKKPPPLTYTPTGRRAPFVVLNFCPFCGKRLTKEAR